MKSEDHALRLSAFASVLVGSVAVAAALLANSQAILLDGLFNLAYFLIALVTLRVSQLARLPGSVRYPFGYSYFESLVNAGKGILILGVSAFALIDALLSLLSGGRMVEPGLAIGYALFATLTCSLTAWQLKRALRQHDSNLVRADQQNWVINSIISAGVLATFCLIPLLQWLDWQQPLPYVDPLLVLAVVLLCLGVPVRMAVSAIQELLNRSAPAALSVPVQQAVSQALHGLPCEHIDLRTVKAGRLLTVIVRVVLAPDYPLRSLRQLDELRGQVEAAVLACYQPANVEVMFTGERHWAGENNPSGN